LAKAETFYRDAVEQARQKGDRPWTAEFLRRLGEVHERSQDWKGALTWYDQSLAIRQELGQKPETARLLAGTGYVKLHLGDYSAALSGSKAAARCIAIGRSVRRGQCHRTAGATRHFPKRFRKSRRAIPCLVVTL